MHQHHRMLCILTLRSPCESLAHILRSCADTFRSFGTVLQACLQHTFEHRLHSTATTDGSFVCCTFRQQPILPPEQLTVMSPCVRTCAIQQWTLHMTAELYRLTLSLTLWRQSSLCNRENWTLMYTTQKCTPTIPLLPTQQTQVFCMYGKVQSHRSRCKLSAL